MGESNDGREERACDWGLINWGQLRSLAAYADGRSKGGREVTGYFQTSALRVWTGLTAALYEEKHRERKLLDGDQKLEFFNVGFRYM